MHKPKMSVSGLALDGLGSGLDISTDGNNVPEECVVGHQVGTFTK